MNDKESLPSIIDIEASGFGATSYPVEIGVVLGCGKRLCYLIRPHKSWEHWDEDAEKLHGISRELLLKSGRLIHEVCRDFNSLLSGKTVYSDGWSHDSRWLQRLYEFSGLECEFTLSPIEAIASEEQLIYWDEVKEELVEKEGGTVRHRATNDAILIQEIFRRSAEIVNR